MATSEQKKETEKAKANLIENTIFKSLKNEQSDICFLFIWFDFIEKKEHNSH